MKNILDNLLLQAIPNLPIRKTISKVKYDLYLLYLEDGSFYVGITNNFNKRLKQHIKIRKNVKCGTVIHSLNSKANILILETWLIINVKLFHKDYNLLNKRSESNQY